jgi:hypothetical protein
MNEQYGLVSRQYFRCAADQPFVRHDLRVWESGAGRQPRLRNAEGKLLLGDDLLNDWRSRAQRGAARVRAYYDVHPFARKLAHARRVLAQSLRRSAADDRART